MRKLVALALAVMMMLTCVPFAMAEEADGENVVTIAMGTSPNLDTHWNAGTTGAWLMMNMREGLYRVTATGFELAGATSVDISDDATVWTFHLREDAVWNDGQPVTAADYVYSMQRLVDPSIATTYMRDYGKFLKNGTAISDGTMDVSELGVKAIDDYTLEITLENPCTYFDSILTYSTFYPLRADCVEEDGTGNWAWDVSKSITNGYMNMVSCDEDQEIVLEKNETYHDADSVALDKLVVKLIDDTNTTLSLLETGEVDLITSYPSEETERLQEAGLYHTSPQLATSFLLVNTQDVDGNPLADANVRKALSLSIDRDFLSNVLMLGTKTPAVAYVGHGFPGSSADTDFRTEGGDLFATDVEQAQQLLADAGYPGGEGFPVITCSYANNSADNTTLFEYLQATWEENLGITVQLEPLESAAMTELRDAGKFDITPQNWGADYIDASNMLSIFVTGNFINAGRYSSEAFDNAYNQSLQTVDQAERMELLHQAEYTLVVEDCGTIPLYHSNAVALYSDEVLSNVVIGANGLVILKDIVALQ